MKHQTCTKFQSLIPGYMDGELSEEQAAPLRQHLLSCQACRGAAQGQTNISNWFNAQPAPEIPADFAARVAQAAFSQPVMAEVPDHLPELVVQPAPPIEKPVEPSILTFVLTLTSVAAGLLICLALFMAQDEQPSETELSAEPLPSILEELDRLNGAERP